MKKNTVFTFFCRIIFSFVWDKEKNEYVEEGRGIVTLNYL